MINLIESGRIMHMAAKNSKYSVAEICRKMEITTTAIYCWFRGESLPSIDNLFLFAEIVGKRPDELIVYKKAFGKKAA